MIKRPRPTQDAIVNFDFSDDQRLLQQEVRKMLAQTSTSAAVREVLEGRAPYCAASWQNLLSMGAAAAALPEHYGGGGLGYLELCLVAEEAGRHLLSAPLCSSFYLGAEALLHGGSETQRQAWLPRIASGDVIATARFDSGERSLRTPAPVFRDGSLSGCVDGVPDGGVAGLAVLRVGAQLLLVDLGASGVTRVAQRSLDPTRPLARLELDRVPAEAMPGDAAEVSRRVLDGAAVLLAFEQVGAASRILEIARDYALTRSAFGRQIGGFQALKHKMADIYMGNELARSHAFYGAWALSSGAPELPRAAAAARVSATTACNSAAEESIEIHGGIGFTWEMDCHLYLRRARHLAQIIGSEHAWRARLADQLVTETA